MAHATIIQTEDGKQAVQWGNREHFEFERGDDTSLVVALVKAVNCGIEAGDDIEGEITSAIADIIKQAQAGDVAWRAEDGYQDLLEDVQAALPKDANGYSKYSVRDIKRDGSAVLVCSWDGGEEDHYVIPITIHGEGNGEDTVVIAPESGWIPVEREFVVSKAGRVLSAKNLKLVQDAADALAALAAAAQREVEDDMSKAAKEPYGDVTYADPGYQEDKKKRYPLDTEEHIRAAWSYINQKDNAAAYSSEDLAKIKSKISAAMKKIGADVEKALDGEDETVQYIPLAKEKKKGTMRYTFGPLYAPSRKDAHGDWVEDETLHKAVHDFVRESADHGREINLQHGDHGEVVAGEWVEVARWPYDHTIVMKQADGTENEVEMPAGTVYMGVVWNEQHWDEESGRPKGLEGLSLGGRAVKVAGGDATMKAMGWKA